MKFTLTCAFNCDEVKCSGQQILRRNQSSSLKGIEEIIQLTGTWATNQSHGGLDFHSGDVLFGVHQGVPRRALQSEISLSRPGFDEISLVLAVIDSLKQSRWTQVSCLREVIGR